MSCIKLYNELNDQFIKMHRVTYLLNKKDLKCINVLENWFASTEIILKENNCVESKIIAQYRGQLIIERLSCVPKLTKRKRDFRAVSKVVNPIKETLLSLIEPMSNKINESEVLINRMLKFKEFTWNEGLNYRDYIHAVWRTLLTEQNTQEDAKMVLNLVGKDDALKLISYRLKPKTIQ